MGDGGAEHGQELADPRRMRRPRRSADQIAVRHRRVDGDVGIGTAGEFHLRLAGRIGRAGAPFQHARRREQLRAVADRGDRLVRREEVADHVEGTRVEPHIFRRPAAGDHQRVVAGRIDIGEGRVQREIVSALLRIGLGALEVVDGRGDAVARLLVRADGMHRMADREQRLERHHGLVILGIVADDHQDALASHSILPCCAITGGVARGRIGRAAAARVLTR